MSTSVESATPLSNGRILKTWWPLAAGWLIMTVEIPGLSAIVARLAEPERHLAAWGVVFPLALILAAPVMMLLSASTALSRDWQSFAQMRRYMWGLSILLTLVHAGLAFTPLYDLVVVGLIAVPPEIVEPARWGLQIMLLWSAAVAYRRFHYGVLIRFGHSSAVTIGAMVRLVVDVVVLSILYLIGDLPGVVVATITITCGVVGEAVYASWRVAPILQTELKAAPPLAVPLTVARFLAFYLPLVMTAFLQVVIQPITAAALSRMPDPLQTLAVWPVVYGLLIIWMSAGMAFTETVVVLFDEPKAHAILHRFTLQLGAATSLLLLLMLGTPLADLWFSEVAALPLPLVGSAHQALWFALLLPGLTVVQSWHSGILLNERRTRGITEAMLIALIGTGVVLGVGILWGQAPGLYVGMAALLVGNLGRSAWLWLRTRPALRSRRQAVSLPSLVA
ncbi:MAG: hypothetical protein KF832_30645 [Caldilineaceae bacterium]|nr:hypothetical protein [Caldilineaceae bacterium]